MSLCIASRPNWPRTKRTSIRPAFASSPLTATTAHVTDTKLGMIPNVAVTAVVEESDRMQEECEIFSTASCSVGPSRQGLENSASLARSFTLIKPTTSIVQRILPRKPINGRPASFMAVMLTSVLYLWLSVRTAISNRVKACRHCGGYGIVRCDLCHGNRVIWWEGKYKHVSPCPKCMGKRSVRCQKCGGVFGRSVFAHTASHIITKKELKKIEQEVAVDDQWVGHPKWAM